MAQLNAEKEVDLYLNELETDFDNLKNKYYEKSMGPEAIKAYIEFAVDKQIDKVDEYCLNKCGEQDKWFFEKHAEELRNDLATRYSKSWLTNMSNLIERHRFTPSTTVELQINSLNFLSDLNGWIYLYW